MEYPFHCTLRAASPLLFPGAVFLQIGTDICYFVSFLLAETYVSIHQVPTVSNLPPPLLPRQSLTLSLSLSLIPPPLPPCKCRVTAVLFCVTAWLNSSSRWTSGGCTKLATGRREARGRESITRKRQGKSATMREGGGGEEGGAHRDRHKRSHSQRGRDMYGLYAFSGRCVAVFRSAVVVSSTEKLRMEKKSESSRFEPFAGCCRDFVLLAS